MSGTAAAREREAAEQRARTAEHERAVAAAGDQLPDWVTSLTSDPSRRSTLFARSGEHSVG